MIPLTFALVAVLCVTAAQGQSNLPPGLFNSSDRAQELIQGPSVDTLDPRTDTMHVFTRVDVMPLAPEAFYAGCARSMRQDVDLVEECFSDTKVYLQFIVERDGSISSSRVLRGGCSWWRKVALSCLEQTTSWKPGMLDGVPVRVQMVMPIQFEPR